jgi:hypothetical protein
MTIEEIEKREILYTDFALIKIGKNHLNIYIFQLFKLFICNIIILFIVGRLL